MKTCNRSFALATAAYALMAHPCIGSAVESGQGSDAVASEAETPSVVADVVSLDESQLNESSGLALSRRDPAHFWSHNDSGDQPRLFAFDRRGRRTGDLRLQSGKAIDWEDMASFTDNGVARLLIADCGDNLSKRSSVQLILLDEPEPTKSSTIRQWQTLMVTYSDGPHDCEAVAVDIKQRRIVLIAKSFLPAAGVYVIPLPPRGNRRVFKVTSKRVATVAVPMVTAMDIDQDNGDIWIANYFHACVFARNEQDITLAQQLTRAPRLLTMPRWKQIEAMAIDDAHQAWITSEGERTPLGRLLLTGNEN